MEINYVFGREKNSKPTGKDTIEIKGAGFDDETMNQMRQLIFKFCKDHSIKITFFDETHPS